MKIAKFIASILALGSVSATVEIAIDNNKIEHAAQQYGQEVVPIFNSPQNRNISEAMHQFGVEAELEIRQSQRAIMKPALKMLKGYVDYFSPNRNCNVDGLAGCLNRFEATGQPMALGMDQCSTQNDCQVRWENLSVQKKMKLERKFGRSSQQMEAAFQQLAQNVTQGYEQARAAQRANIEWVHEKQQNATKSLLIGWGCEASCVNNITDWSDMGFYQQLGQCGCPSPVKANITNVPFNNVTLDESMDDETELNTAATPQKTDANAGIKNGKLSANVNVNGLTTTVVLIFVLQLVFCFVICAYTQRQVTASEAREEKQKSEFYSFLYQFHRQMADEEQMMHELYGKQGGGAGGTPGASAGLK